MIASKHPSRDDLAAYALSDDPMHASYEHVRLHMEAGCASCDAIFAECIALRDRLNATEDAIADWIRPERVESVVGVRSGTLADHQLVCGAGPYELDVLVREFEDSPLIKYQGQVTLAGRIHEPAKDLSLCLVDATATETLLGTHTNEFGEFGLTSHRDGCYGLRIGNAPDAPCVLVWEGWAA